MSHKIGAQHVITDASRYTLAMDYSAATVLLYAGNAHPGTAKSEALWQIKKMVYDGNGDLTDVQWADGNTKFDNIWNDRASLSYS